MKSCKIHFMNKNKAERPANSRERWAGALREVRSLFGLNSAIKKMHYRPTDRRTDGQTLIYSRLFASKKLHNSEGRRFLIDSSKLLLGALLIALRD